MTNPRALEHIATALAQRDPARRARLALLALRADPRDAATNAVMALCLPLLADAAPFVARALDAARRPDALRDMPMTARLAVEAVRVVDGLSGLDVHAATRRARAALPLADEGPVRDSLRRLALAGSAALGDLEGMQAVLSRGEGRADAWFRHILARGIGTGGSGVPAGEAGAGVADALSGGDVPAGNPGAFDDGDDATVRAAVLPGLFRMGAVSEAVRP